MSTQEVGSQHLPLLVQALDNANWPTSPRLWLITAGSMSVDVRKEIPRIENAPMWGMGRTIAREHPELRATLVDLSAVTGFDRDTGASRTHCTGWTGRSYSAARPRQLRCPPHATCRRGSFQPPAWRRRTVSVRASRVPEFSTTLCCKHSLLARRSRRNRDRGGGVRSQFHRCGQSHGHSAGTESGRTFALRHGVRRPGDCRWGWSSCFPARRRNRSPSRLLSEKDCSRLTL